MQMGRWFGFRDVYRDLVRLYIGREEPAETKGKKQPHSKTMDLYRAFEAARLDEMEFPDELKKYAAPADGKSYSHRS